MHTFDMQTPFGRVVFLLAPSIELLEPPRSITREVAPTLPEGQRIDSCSVTTIEANVPRDCELDVGLHCELKDGFFSSFSPGEVLDAQVVEGPFFKGAFGMRDDEWFSFSPHMSARAPTRNSVYRIRLSASEECNLLMEFASAWTTHPNNEQEEIAPWFAIDLAMNSKEFPHA